jgi:hypothetical protein
MNKAIYDAKAPTKNLITTITGVITLILSILVGFGVIDITQSTEINAQAGVLIQAGVAAYGAIVALIAVFKSKDA